MPDPVTNGGNRRTFGRAPLALSALAQYNPNRPDATEAIWQPFYDFTTYAAAGQTSLSFFQTPQGSGGKTFADTNMTLAGQFPAPTAFLCTAIMLAFFPAGNPSATGTQGAVSTYWNDAVAVANSGFMEFAIGSKVYLRDAPIGKFPPNFTINGVFGGFGSSTAGVIASVGYARAAGRYYEITPFLIPQSQNFSVQITWPAAVAVSATGRIGCILDGFYYRQSQ